MIGSLFVYRRAQEDPGRPGKAQGGRGRPRDVQGSIWKGRSEAKSAIGVTKIKLLVTFLTKIPKVR